MTRRWPGFDCGLQAQAFRARGNDAGLLQAAVEFGRRFNMRRERLDAGGKRGVRACNRHVAPVHGRLLHGRGLEVVTERGAKGGLVAGRNAMRSRMGEIAGVGADQQFDEGLALGAAVP